jgi:hypothetical protein
MSIKVKEIEQKHREKQELIKEQKAKVVSQIKELDFNDLKQTQKIKIALTLSKSF